MRIRRPIKSCDTCSFYISLRMHTRRYSSLTTIIYSSCPGCGSFPSAFSPPIVPNRNRPSLPVQQDPLRETFAQSMSPAPIQSTIVMDNPPLASLSLTHVHYVYMPDIRPEIRLIAVEPRRPHLISLRMAGPRAPRTMRGIRNFDMEQSRD